MKKFLSYLLVFVTVFAISTTITIKVKSELLDSAAPTITADASGESSLLGGMMNSFEENPELSINGTIDLSIGEEQFNILLAASVNLETLTNPNIDASITINYNDNATDIRLVVVDRTIFVSHNNIQIKASLDDISNAVEAMRGLFENVSLDLNVNSNSSFVDSLTEKILTINVDSLIGALSDPKKTLLEELVEYEIELPDICKLFIVCDDQFNISSVRISDFVLIENVNVSAELYVAQDSKINIQAPTNESYFDIAAAIRGVGELFQEDYLRVDTWVNLYKNGAFKQALSGYVNLNNPDSKYQAQFDLKGKIEASLVASYVDETLYATFNDINLSAQKTTIEQLIELVKEQLPQIEFNLPDVDLASIVNYIKQNYKQILNDATILNSQIKIKLDLSTFVAGLDNLSVIIDFDDNYKISKLFVNGLAISDYSLMLTAYVNYPESLNIEVKDRQYLPVEKLFSFVETLKSLEKFEISGHINLNTELISQNFGFNAIANAKTKEFVASVQNLFGLDINVAYLDSRAYNYPIYLNVGDIYLSITKDYLNALVGEKLEELLSNISLPQTADISNFAKELLQKYWIGDILKLSQITITDGHVQINSDLSVLAGETFKFDLDLDFSETTVKINNFEIEFGENKISADFEFATTEKEIKVADMNKYLDARWLVDYVQSFISSENLMLDGKVNVSNAQENLFGFDGQIGFKLAAQNFVIDGNIDSIISGDAKVVYKNQRLYLDYGAQHYNISKQAIIDICGGLGFDAAPYIQKVENILNQVSTLDIFDFAKEKIDSIDFEAVDISSIDLQSIDIDEGLIETIINIISSTKINSRTIEFSAKISDININAKLSLFNTLGLLAEVDFGDYHISVDAELSKETANYDISDQSICLDPIATVVSDVKNILKSSSFEGRATINFGEKSYESLELDYKLSVDIQNKLINAQIVAKICNREVVVHIIDNQLYVSFSGIKISATIEQVLEILKDNLFEGVVPEEVKNLDLSNISLDNLLDGVLDFINSTTLINSLEQVGDDLSIRILDVLDVLVRTNSNELAAHVEYQNVNADVTLQTKESVEFDTINKSEYMQIDDAFDIVKNIYNFALGNAYYANVNLSVSGYVISGYVGYDSDGLVADLSTTVFGKSLNVKIANRVVYINLDGFKAKLDFADAADLLEKAVSAFSIDIDQDLLDTISAVLRGENFELSGLTGALGDNLSIEDIINSAEIELSQDEIRIQLLGADIVANLEDKNLSTANITYATDNISVEVGVVLVEKQQIELEQAYVDLAGAQNILHSVAGLVSDTKYVVTFNTEIADVELTGSAGIVIAGGELKLEAHISALGREVALWFMKNLETSEYAIYVALDGVRVMVTLDDISDIIAWINQTFDKDIQLDIEFIKNLLEDFNIERLLSKFDLTKLSLQFSDNDVTVTYGDISLDITFDSTIEIMTQINDVTVNATIAQNEPITTEPTGEYTKFENVFETIKNIYSYISKKEYYLNLDLSLDIIKDNNITTIDLAGYVGYDSDGLVAELSTTLLGKQLSVKLVDKVLYVSLDGLKVKLAFADAYNLLEKAAEAFNLNIDEQVFDIIKTILTSEELNSEELIDKVKALSDADISLESIVQELAIALSQSRLTLDVLDANIVVEFENNNVDSAAVTYESDKFAIDLAINFGEKRSVVIDGDYANLADAKNILGSIANIITQKQLVGSVNISYDKIDISGTYQISFVDGLALSFSFNAYGLDVNIVVLNKTLYLSIEDVKVKANIGDINNIIAWVNQTFDTNIEFDAESLDEGTLDLSGLLDKFDLSKLNLSISGNVLNVSYGEVEIVAELGDSISATITYQKQAAEGEEQRKPLVVTLSGEIAQTNVGVGVTAQDYESYTVLTDLVDSVMQIVNNKKVSLTLPNINVYEGTSVHYTASGALQVDWSDKDNMLFHAQVVVRDNQKGKDYDVRLSYRNGYWWIYFNNLKIKMSKADVNELLVIILKVMDIDTTLIPSLAEISTNLDDINFDSLSAILPNFKDFSPFDLLGYVTNLSLENGRLICDIDSSLVTDNLDATNMRVVVDASNGRLSGIYGQNIYTGVTNAEHLDISILVDQNFAGVGSPAAGNYLDLSGSNELIKALFNTAELNDFNVSGTVAASLGSWDLVDIPLVLQVKLDENRKPTIYVKLDLSVLTDSLISSAANTFVFDSDYRKNHIIQIYYKDGYVYFYCTGETKPLLGSGTKHAKLLKAHIDSVLEDPMYYLKFALSFSDSIENQITKSLASNADHEPDLGKIIKSYTVSNSKNFEIVLDMKEISGDDVLGDTTIDIGVINNSSTGYKNYLGTAGFDFIIDFGLKIHLSSSNIKLSNIGQSLNFTAINNFINNYAYGEGKEMTSSNGGSSYSVAGGKKYSVTFDSNGGTSVATKTDYPGATFTLPTLANKVVTGNGTRDVYRFAGWWEDSTLIKTPYTSGTIGHTNITVYAKWELIEEYRTVSFYLDGAKVADSLMLVGSNMEYSGLQQTRVVETGGYKKYQSFERYADSSGNTIATVGGQNQNVYIIYQTTLALKSYTLSFESGLAPSVDSKLVYETESYASLMPSYTTILVEEGDTTYYYTFDGWFTDESRTVAANGTMPSHNLTLYAKLTFLRSYTVKLLTIYDNNQKIYEERVEVGTAITLPNSINVDTYTQWYTTSGYTLQVSLPAVMPNENTTLHIRNRYTVTYTYYTISNHAKLNTNSSSQNLYQGEAFTYPSQTNDYIDYKNSSNVLDYRLYYTFNGYKNGTETYSTMPNHNVNLTSTYSTTRKNYYTISFDMTLDYIPKSCAAGAHYKSTPSTPASLRLLEGSVVNLKESKYQISATIWATAFSFGVKYNYKSTTWGTSTHSDYSDGGDGATSWTVSGNATLKPYWKKQ